MDPLSLLAIGGAGAVGALAGAAACHWSLSRRLTILRDRVERAEQARNGAIERSAHARDQIAQLNKAIDELRRAHSVAGLRAKRTETPQERREAAERALSAAASEQAPATLQAFADTEVLGGP